MTKAALRLLGGPELADAIGDLTGLGRANVEMLAREASDALASTASMEFRELQAADREWSEGVLVRSYRQLAGDPGQSIVRESVVGPHNVSGRALEQMSPQDRIDFEKASQDVRGYLTSFSEAIAVQVCGWYESDAESNRVATTRALGETLDRVRKLPEQLDQRIQQLELLLPQVTDAEKRGRLEPPSSASGESAAADPVERISFLVDNQFAPCATDSEFARLVERAVVAVIEERPVEVVVSPPSFSEFLKLFDDPVVRAAQRRHLQERAAILERDLNLLFSRQVNAYWGNHLHRLADRVIVARAVFATHSTTGTHIAVWRTEHPELSAPVFLTPSELAESLEHLGFSSMRFLSVGPGWRAALDLPHSIVTTKVMPAILGAVGREEQRSVQTLPDEVLALWSWHIGQG